VRRDKIEKRKLGNTGERLSIVGFGGIVVKNETLAMAERAVGQAVDRGIDYFDVSPTYGNAEELLGVALKPYRSSIFLSCKTLERTSDGSIKALHKSLERLGTDYIDLYQFHRVNTQDEIELIIGKNGALETFLKAQKDGLIRYIGFTSHSEETALRFVDCFKFDTVLFPINWVCWKQANFGKSLISKAKKNGVGVLAIKALAKSRLGEEDKRKWQKCWYAPVDNYDEASLALRFTLSKPVVSALSPGQAELLWWACDVAENFRNLSDEEDQFLEKFSHGIEPLFYHGELK
jgi:aryl-alcohol dehydrogenase-like predicted oxidoreductase